MVRSSTKASTSTCNPFAGQIRADIRYAWRTIDWSSWSDGEVLDPNPHRHDVNLISIQAEQIPHEVGVILRKDNEGVDVFGNSTNFSEGFRLVRLDQVEQEEVVSLERDDDRTAQFPFNHRNAAADQDVRKIDEVRLCLSLEPIDESKNLFADVAVLSLEHRDRQITQIASLRLHPARRKPIDEPGAIKHTVHPAGEKAENEDLFWR